MPQLAKPNMPATKDKVVESIRKALRATQAAQQEAYGDLRTSSTLCTDHLDQAVSSLENARQWMAEYQKEVLADERRSIAVSVPRPQPKQQCHICDNQIDASDLAVCGGCDEPTCPECMGDDGICKGARRKNDTENDAPSWRASKGADITEGQPVTLTAAPEMRP